MHLLPAFFAYQNKNEGVVQMLKVLIRDPLVIFLGLGVIVFGLYYGLEEDDSDAVELSESNRNVFAEQFELLTGRQATQADLAKIEDDYIREEVLFREAIDAGMHLIDPEVREKLVQEMRYQITGYLPDPDEAKLVAYYLKHIDRYYEEPTYSFQHVFFEQLPDNSEGILAKLTRGEEVKGDEFWRGRLMPAYGVSMIRGMFGKVFLDTMDKHAFSEWYGPQESLLGWHFVKVTHSTPRSPLTFDEAKMQVTNDYVVDRLDSAVKDYIDDLGDKYRIIKNVKE